MTDTVIKAENLSKSYLIGHQTNGKYETLRDVIVDKTKGLLSKIRGSQSNTHQTFEEFWALKNVSFEVKRGERLGIIGRNGAGKSTLLKILSRITEPTTGRISIKGRVASLLEVGTGFHPELTGRENIFLNGAILGMSRQEIKRKFDEIVAFAEIEKFLDTPVKRYSSGMYVRLAFAVAAFLEPEILIVDEVLSVGDASFQKKCLGKMNDVAQEGRTILFVSHNISAVNSLTQNCLYLKNGQFVLHGKTQKVIEQYLMDSVPQGMADLKNINLYRRDSSNDSPLRIIGIWINDLQEQEEIVDLGSTFKISTMVQIDQKIQDAHLTIILKNMNGERIFVLFSGDRNFLLSLAPGQHLITVEIRNLALVPGQYLVDAGINQSTQTVAWDVIVDFPILKSVNNGQITQWLDRPWGAIHCQNVSWQIEDAKQNGRNFCQLSGTSD